MSIKPALKSQYHASLAMLREAIDTCPAELWTSDGYTNRFWHVAYHVLFYTHFYLQPSEADFVPWERHRDELNRFEREPGAAAPTPYTVEEMRAYWTFVDSAVDATVERLDLAAPTSGFWWYEMSKLEHQLVNLRHLQHHTGQLIDRLRQHSGRGVEWAGGARPGG